MVIKFSELEKVIEKWESYPAVDILELEAPPIHPGEVLREEFLKPLGLTQSQLAKELGVSFRAINDESEQYTWWSNRGQSWANNTGWRIDYQIITPGLKDKVVSL